MEFQCKDIDYDEMMEARLGYFACVSYLDEIIGDMLTNLERDGLLENTIIVYCTDHGEMAGEHGLWWKNGWFEACTRVPLMISTPETRSEKKNMQCTTPAALLDLFPTLCELCGLEIPDDLQGRNLTAAFEGEKLPNIPVYCDSLLPRWGEGTEFRSVRYQNYKYVRFREVEPLFFDLDKDPGEQVNLLAQKLNPEAEAALKILRDFAEKSIDFEQVDKERLERDGELHDKYKLELDIDITKTKGIFWNSYIFPDGRMICADDVIYEPTVLLNKAKDVLS